MADYIHTHPQQSTLLLPLCFSVVGVATDTMYPANYTKQVSLFSYDMSLPPGRTYRYYTGRPLFEFGTGLSLTTFSVNCTGACTTNPTLKKQWTTDIYLNNDCAHVEFSIHATVLQTPHRAQSARC
eukprot:COSAG05_NODE_737_length_7636_cov_48.020433_5_plen_126_part_00